MRLNLEKGTRGKNHQNDVSTAQKIANELKVGKATVERDAKFAKAIDSIAETAGEEARTAILKRQVPGRQCGGDAPQ